MTQRWALDPTSQRVALTVLRRGPISRADLGRSLGLSSASVTRLTRPMVQAGLLVEGPPQGRSAGRPALPLDIAADSATFIGMKLSHEGLKGVLTDLRGTVLARADTAGERLGPDACVDAVADLIGLLTPGRRRPPHALGVSLGATVAEDGLVRGARFLGWQDPVDLGGLLERRTGLPTIVDNDVNAFTVAEHWFGVGRGADDFAVVTIGAGVGLGVVADDELVRGHAGAAGMVGEVVVPGGLRAADVLDQVAVEARLQDILGRVVAPAQAPALAADTPALGVLLDEIADAVGYLAGTVTTVTAPERILVAGEGAPLLAGREDRVRAMVARMHPPEVSAPCVVVDIIGDDEWARGAAALAIRAHMGADRSQAGAS